MPFDWPFVLRLSKDERLAQDMPVEPRTPCHPSTSDLRSALRVNGRPAYVTVIEAGATYVDRDVKKQEAGARSQEMEEGRRKLEDTRVKKAHGARPKAEGKTRIQETEEGR